MIAIQCIETWWTKASRGAPGAGARASAPDALPLPQRSCSREVLLQRVMFEERTGFTSHSEVSELSLQEAQRQVRGVVLHVGPDVVDVMFTWSGYSVGAPQRRNGPAMRLEPGRWCRIVHNGRFDEDNRWYYQQTTLNIAYVPPDARIFVASDPRKIDDHRVQLR